MPGDHGKENPCGSVRPGAALFPIAQRCWLEPKSRGEIRLAQTKLFPRGANIDGRHLNRRHPNWDLFPLGPVDSFLQARNDAATRAWLAPFCFLSVFHNCRPHFVNRLRYPAIKRGSSFFISFRSALVRFPFSFLANTLSKNRGMSAS